MRHRLAILFPVYVLVFALGYAAAFELRFEFDIPEAFETLLWDSLPLVLMAKLAASLVSGEWRRTYRYPTMTDVIYLVACATGAAVGCYLLNVVLFSTIQIPRSVILIDWMLTVLALALLRCGMRVYREAVRPLFGKRNRHYRTLIYGVDGAAVSLLRTLQATGAEYRVVAFVDDGDEKRNSMISGIRVYSVDRGWMRLRRKLNAEHVLIPSTVPGKTVRAILEECSAAGLRTHIIPGVNELVDGKYKIAVRDVTISDLLRRKPAELDMDSIRDYISGRRVLVTGAAGSIGSELCRQIVALEPESLVFVDHSEIGVFTIEQEFRAVETQTALHFVIAGVTDVTAMRRVMEEHRPQLVFHAAAYKHVPLMEAHPQEAIRNNIFGTKTVVDLADEYGVERFVLISTDKAVKPSSIMGATKLMAEKYLQAVSTKSATQFITVRFGNVLNSAGSVVPTFRKQIEAGGPVTVTHPEMLRFFMTIPEAVQLVHQAGAIGRSGDVLILEMGDPVKIVDLAKDMILLSGLKYPDDIDIVFTGLRPGEKLAEELFYETESDARKVHDKIYSARRRRVSLAEVKHDLHQLDAALGVSRQEAAAVLREIVGRYVAADETPASPMRSAA